MTTRDSRNAYMREWHSRKRAGRVGTTGCKPLNEPLMCIACGSQDAAKFSSQLARLCIECRKARERAQVKAAKKKQWDKYKRLNTEGMRRYRARNPYAARPEEWKIKNRREAAAAWRLRRARQLGSSGSYTEADVAACLERQGGRCFYCLRSLQDGYHVDHMTPLSRGGSNGAENIVCACPTCNRSKSNKTAAEFMLAEAT